MSEFHFDEPKHGHRLPHDRLKGLSNGVGRMCPVSLTGSVLRAAGRHTEVNSRRGVFCSGPLDLRAQDQVANARRTDTPMRFLGCL